MTCNHDLLFFHRCNERYAKDSEFEPLHVKRLNQHDSGTFTYLYIVLLDYVRTIYMSWDLDVKIIRIKFSVRLRDGLLEA